MKIDSVDFFYLSMPAVLDIGDGSQDALLVRIRAGNYEGWGECEASPLTSIASYVCPMSHSACKPLKHSLEGKSINHAKDIKQITEDVRQHSFDLLQADHTLSGIDIALWDLWGKKLEEPVYKLLGYKKAYPKLPYASQLFGETPEETFLKGQKAKAMGFRAVKFGWGSFGKKGLKHDRAQLKAARESVGKDVLLMIDAGTIWNNKLAAAQEILPDLKKINVCWLEEPFGNLSLEKYKKLSKAKPSIALAAGEGCHNFTQAELMIKYAGLKYIQADAGRIGGITAAKQVAELANAAKVSYVNHTFTSHLALSASLQPYAGIRKDAISEYPIELKKLAQDITRTKILPDKNGFIHLPEKEGLGIEINAEALRKYLVDAEIKVNGKTIYYTPEF